MKLSLGLVLAAISLLSVLPLAQAATSTSPTASTGFVAYSVQATLNGTSHNLSVNESVKPSSAAGKSIVLVTVEAASSNFTYSHVVNSSATLFPYLQRSLTRTSPTPARATM